jgi:hypothetical protein
LAISVGKKPIVEELLLYGANPLLADASGKTLMQYAGRSRKPRNYRKAK